MLEASCQHAKDIGASGNQGHEGGNGSSIQQRIEKYTKIEGMIGESIDYGEKDAEFVIIDLLIDDDN